MTYSYTSALLAAAILTLASCTKDPAESREQTNSTSPVIVNTSASAVNGEIVFKLRSEASNAVETTRATRADRTGIQEIDRILSQVNTVKFERLFPDGGRFEARTRREGLHLWYYTKYDPTVPTKEMANMLASCRDIEIIEYSLQAASSDYTQASAPTIQSTIETRAVSDAQREVEFPFNEDARTQAMQWHYNNRGQVFSKQVVMGADANVYAAWQLCTGNPDVIVAVVDQGVKYDHEDLAANMWINQAELNGTAGVDDDSNGYVDDIYGYNFTKNTGTLTFSKEQMHGTHVAGTISAVNNNGIGVNGIAGGSGHNDGVKIMSCEILAATESGSTGAGLAGQIRAIKYAADNGAVICQNSWGYSTGTISETDWSKGVYSALSRAIQYFIKYAGMDENGRQVGPMAGGIVTFAAGNDALNERHYPGSDPAVISVSALSYLNTPSAYTNYGSWVSISAPGGDQQLSPDYGGVYSTSVALDGTSEYEGIQGTSMACPHVSGACALAISYYYGEGKHKGLTNEMLRQALLSSARPIDPYCIGSYAKYRGLMGIGLLDTYKLLLSIAKIDGIPTQNTAKGQTINLDLSHYFVSTNTLTYTISNTQVISVDLTGGIMQIKGLTSGQSTIVVSDGKAIRKPFEVIVK